MPTRTTNWEQIYELAREAGAKYPELVAAQWHLESGAGKKPSGKNNYFGLKSATSDGGTLKPTTEVINGQTVKIKARFKDFESVEEAVKYLVRLWYKDYETYSGVNRAPNREAAARLLQEYSYATDPEYGKKLIEIMREHDLTPSSGGQGVMLPANESQQQEALFSIEALQDTWLKKRPEQADDLPENEKVAVARGRSYGVLAIREIPGSAHAAVDLAAGAGRWCVFLPHWKQHGPASSVSPIAIDWSNFGQRVTPHCTVGEVVNYDLRRRPTPGSRAELNILATLREFESMRVAWGRPIGFTSFYRPEPYNQQVGGVPGSYHTTGQAMDVYPVNMPIESFYQWIRNRWRGGLGDGRHRGFVHLDLVGGGFVPGAGVRPSREWTY